MKLRRCSAFALFALLTAAVAQAHPGHDGGHELTWDFTAGVLHPLSGWDHLLAMVSVGLWAAFLGGRARWMIPSAFVLTMTAAAILAPSGMSPSLIEQGIAASLLGLGLLLAFGVRLPISVSVALVAVFAAFHGYAHGAELPIGANGLSYGIGFIFSTIVLHTVGLALGYSAQHYPKAIRATGALVAAVGFAAVMA